MDNLNLDERGVSSRRDRPAALPLRVFASPRLPLTPQELAGLERVATLEDVAQVVALPDLHLKPQLETPSSTVTATHQSIILSLSSPSAGCGMALALTALFAEAGKADLGGDLSAAHLDQLFTQLARLLPLRRDGLSPRFAQPGSAGIEQILLHGAAGAVQRFDLDPRLTGYIERQGNALASPAQTTGSQALTPELVLSAIPPQFLSLAAREFGGIGAGNHFLELQVVEEILDQQVASRWSVQPGQVVVMYHADSGRLGALLGRWYAYRRKNNWRGRWLELRYKTAFHFSQAGSVREAYSRANYYFAPRRHTALPAGSPLARQALLAMGAATNYAYANRVAILAALRDSLQAVWGRRLAAPTLLYDVTHNSIRQEQGLWVHRHNASQALPAGHRDLQGTPYAETGQPVLLPGTHRTCSYLCAAGPEASGSLYSVDHGAGRSAWRLGQERPAAGGATRLYDTQRGYLGDQQHLSRDGVDEVLAVLSQAGLARPVARLRPVAVLKDRPG